MCVCWCVVVVSAWSCVGVRLAYVRAWLMMVVLCVVVRMCCSAVSLHCSGVAFFGFDVAVWAFG